MQRKGAIAVTGASRGIGAAIATALAEGGHIVGCLSRKGELPAGIDARLAPRMIAAQCDVDDEPGMKQAFSALAATAGGIWGLVNNAGIHLHGASDVGAERSFCFSCVSSASCAVIRFLA